MPETYRPRRRRDPEYRDAERGRVIPFQRGPAPDRDADATYAAVPRPLREEAGDWGEPPARTARPFRRRARSRIQRNAISIIGVCFLLAVLGVGYGLMQVVGQAASPAPTSISAVTAAPTADAPNTSASATVPFVAAAPTGPREVQSSVQALDPNYTVKAGDTLNAIATQFNTTGQRIQALNDLADPRSLKIGQKLVVPPPL